MTVQSILSPVFVLVLLAFALLVWMARARSASARSGEVKLRGQSTRAVAWPGRTQQISDCFHNQLELPLLFYALVPIAMLTRKADLVFVVLSWAFVVTRYLHAFEHTGQNRIGRRLPAFAAGALILMALWAYVAFGVMTD